MAAAGVADRCTWRACAKAQELIDAFHALDVFAFASQTETQGMVLTEAMAAGKPVVALDGPGVRDVVRDRANGRLVAGGAPVAFAQALAWIAVRSPAAANARCDSAARRTAERFSMPRQAHRALASVRIVARRRRTKEEESFAWTRARRRIEAEWTLWSNVAHAATHALGARRGPQPMARSSS